jgi:hypothetical protein
VPLSFQASEDIFGKAAATFSFSWRMFTGDANSKPNPANLPVGKIVSDAVTKSGLWKPLNDAGYPAYATSMARVWSARGSAGIGSFPNDDLIVDACLATGQLNTMSATGVDTLPVRLVAGTEPIASPGYDGVSTFLLWENKVIFDDDGGIVRLKPLPQGTTLPVALTTGDPLADPSSGSSGNTYSSYFQQVGATIANLATTTNNAQPDILQQRVSATLRIRLVGRATRVVFPISPPTLVSVGGVPAIPAGGTFEQAQTANLGGLPVYQATWELRYEVPIPPTGPIGALPNIIP